MNLGEEMGTHDIDIELPAEFRSGNDIPVTQATIKRERMTEILRDAIEADRQQRHLKERAQLNQEWAALKDMQGVDSLEVLRRVWQPHTQSNVDRMSEQDIAKEIEEEMDWKQRGEPVAWRWLYNGKPDSETCYPLPLPGAVVRERASAAAFPRTVQVLYASPQPAEPVKHREVK